MADQSRLPVSLGSDIICLLGDQQMKIDLKAGLHKHFFFPVIDPAGLAAFLAAI